MDEIEPKFGEWLRGIYASERNPQRDGMYVRTIRRTGRTNPGTYYELTDGKGSLWSYPTQSVERTPKPAPAMLNGVEEAEEVLRSALGIARKINQDESGDEWLNLSADLLRLLQKALSPRVGLTIFRAADNRDAAGVDADEDAYVIEHMGKLLAEIAVIVNGPEPPLTRWSYHDLPEKVQALKDAARQAT